ncbi:hypothetical protein [Hymenobacter ruricola]|uniref:CHAD domain-containing protein n=1 Tax=Hymenobacter ruricola TaxID=2791023 RepID=A0ABS0I185_9BACT|nr:hypothetical protein [Hymenobacter ruricola]MBF9220704.1 hypothetical protein [Hymenobacter ruricola]
MSVRLKRLISHYEAERRTLTAAVDECVAESEYGTANRLAKGLWRVQRKLQVLMTLQDPLHGEKEMTKRHIEGLEKLSTSKHIEGLEELSTAETGRILDYYRERIATEKKKLAALVARVPAENTAPPATTLHNALARLLDARIAAFTLELSGPKRLRLTFRRLRKTLLIMLPEVRRHRAAYTLQKRHVRFLRGLGFRPYDQGDQLLLFVPFGEVAAIQDVKSMLARIVFDCFIFEELKGKSSIKYYEPEA